MDFESETNVEVEDECRLSSLKFVKDFLVCQFAFVCSVFGVREMEPKRR
ncbi:hypothetical protein Hanom_Chr17g01559641 [Helianthus anomalus]